ncbi:MAG TPA: VWA domain-containing protein, partial [Pyrinomonadaceae bacterium]|nr:VWA domain-containing protein [Pyrinomonadaceae bacterium]
MKRITVILLLIFGFGSIVSAQTNKTPAPAASPTPASKQNAKEASNTPDTVEDNDVLRVDTSLVTIPVSVLDRNGRYLSDLRQEDFKIFEDGKEQEIAYLGTTEQPFTVVLLLDMSLSAMFKIKEIQDAAIEFVKQLKPQDRIMVVSFDEKIHVLSEATTDRDKVVKAIRKTDFDDGTSLYNAVSFVIKKKLDKIEGRKAIVLFTDGVDTTSYKTDALGSLRDAEESGATVFPVAYSTYDDVQERLKTEEDPEDEEILGTTRAEYEEGERYLNDLTARTGGKLYRADSTVNLGAAFAGIAEELRRQYSIG